MTIFEQIALKIIKAQEPIIGPIAWHEAKNISDISILDQKEGILLLKGNGKKVIEALVYRYRTMFGKTAHRVCIDAAKDLIQQLPVNEIPENLVNLQLSSQRSKYSIEEKTPYHLEKLARDLYDLNIEKSILKNELSVINQKLTASNQKLEQLNKIKAEFVSQSRHDVGTPLTKIKGYLSMIQEGEYGHISAELKRILEIMEKSSDSLISTMNEIMSVLKVEPNEIGSDKSTVFDMVALCKELLSEYKLLAINKGINLTLNIKDNSQYKVIADQDKILRALRSIINNSMMCTENGYIQIELGTVNNIIELKISDTGIRYTSSVLSRVIEKLLNIKGHSDLNIVTSDLDLYLAKQIIEDYKGQFTIISSPNGTEFRIELSNII